MWQRQTECDSCPSVLQHNFLSYVVKTSTFLRHINKIEGLISLYTFTEDFSAEDTFICTAVTSTDCPGLLLTCPSCFQAPFIEENKFALAVVDRRLSFTFADFCDLTLSLVVLHAQTEEQRFQFVRRPVCCISLGPETNDNMLLSCMFLSLWGKQKTGQLFWSHVIQSHLVKMLHKCQWMVFPLTALKQVNPHKSFCCIFIYLFIICIAFKQLFHVAIYSIDCVRK